MVHDEAECCEAGVAFATASGSSPARDFKQMKLMPVRPNVEFDVVE